VKLGGVNCGVNSGCQDIQRPDTEAVEEEHVAGPGCVYGRGYTGHQISVEEMEGCRAVQCLARKEEDWKPEDDDQNFERDSGYFLTGLGDGSPDEAPLDEISPARHGVDEILPNNLIWVSI